MSETCGYRSVQVARWSYIFEEQQVSHGSYTAAAFAKKLNPWFGTYESCILEDLNDFGGEI